MRLEGSRVPLPPGRVLLLNFGAFEYHWEVVVVRGSFAAPALLVVHISALHDTVVPVKELGRGRLGGMAHGGRTGLTVLSVLVSKLWKCDVSTYKVSGVK